MKKTAAQAPTERRCDCKNRFPLTEHIGTRDDGTEVYRCRCGKVHEFTPPAKELI